MENLTLVIPAKEEKESLPKVLQEIEKFKCKKKIVLSRDDKETIEASEAFGATKLQKLRTVQIPLALPTVFAGVNQTIMMALAMVVIASMIGVKGLGVPILRAVLNQYLALGLFNGLAIVALAIIFDRAAQEYGRRIQKHRGIKR